MFWNRHAPPLPKRRQLNDETVWFFASQRALPGVLTNEKGVPSLWRLALKKLLYKEIQQSRAFAKRMTERQIDPVPSGFAAPAHSAETNLSQTVIMWVVKGTW